MMCHSLHKEWGVGFYLLEYGIQLHKLCGILYRLSVLHFLSKLFIAVWTHDSYTSVYNATLLYCVDNGSRFSHREFLKFVPVS